MAGYTDIQATNVWVSIAGLCANLLGVLVIAIPTTRFISSPLLGRVNNSKQLKEAKKELFSDQSVEESDEYFAILMSFIRKEYGGFEENQFPHRITSGPRFDVGMTVAVIYEENGDDYHEIIAPVAVFDNWIENEIERTYLRLGLAFVALGFILQLISDIVV